jgi:hypothetical protein
MDLRLDSKNDSRDQIYCNLSNEFSIEFDKHKNQIFNDKVTNYLKTNELGPVDSEHSNNYEYCIIMIWNRFERPKIIDNSLIKQEVIDNDQDSFHKEVEDMIKCEDIEVTEGSILERNKQKFNNLNPVLF